MKLYQFTLVMLTIKVIAIPQNYDYNQGRPGGPGFLDLNGVSY